TIRYPLSCRYFAIDSDSRPGLDESPTTAMVLASPRIERSSGSPGTYGTPSSWPASGIISALPGIGGIEQVQQRPEDPRRGPPDHVAVHVEHVGFERPPLVDEFRDRR